MSSGTYISISLNLIASASSQWCLNALALSPIVACHKSTETAINSLRKETECNNMEMEFDGGVVKIQEHATGDIG